MAVDQLWALIALLALAGWAATNVFHARAGINVANAFSILEKMDERMDNRISSVVERIQRRETKKPPELPGVMKTGTAMDEINSILGGEAFDPIGDQPDAGEGLEVAG